VIAVDAAQLHEPLGVAELRGSPPLSPVNDGSKATAT
jgi:hypothetical protein